MINAVGISPSHLSVEPLEKIPLLILLYCLYKISPAFIHKCQDRTLVISEEVWKKKFVFNTKGKLTKKEVVELKRTHKNNIFDWVS